MNRDSSTDTRKVPAALHAAGTPESNRPGDGVTDPQAPRPASPPPPPEPARPARPPEPARPAQPPETARRPVPGVKHEPEPDAGNIMPAEDEPGTL